MSVDRRKGMSGRGFGALGAAVEPFTVGIAVLEATGASGVGTAVGGGVGSAVCAL